MSSRGSVIGIDPSVQAPAFAIWPRGETWQLRIDGQGAERLRDLYCVAKDWTRVHAPDDLEAIFIERPVGRFPKRALDHACGVLQVAAIAGTSARFPHPVSVWELSPGEWKKQVGLGGAAKKHEVAAWARAEAGEGLTQDEADALCIAAAGHSLVRTGQVPCAS
jgi:hypothetical protein